MTYGPRRRKGRNDDIKEPFVKLMIISWIFPGFRQLGEINASHIFFRSRFITPSYTLHHLYINRCPILCRSLKFKPLDLEHAEYLKRHNIELTVCYSRAIKPKYALLFFLRNLMKYYNIIQFKTLRRMTIQVMKQIFVPEGHDTPNHRIAVRESSPTKCTT